MSEPKIIYLGPACEAETGDGRTWAEDNPWPNCECGHRPVQYVLGETFDRVVAERDGLQLALNTADQTIDDLQAAVSRRTQRIRELECALREMLNDDDGLLAAAEISTGFVWSALQKHAKAISAALKPAKAEQGQGIPGTSFQRLNMLANQGE